MVGGTPGCRWNRLCYLHRAEPPGFDVISGVESHPHDLVGRHAQQLVLLLAVEPHDEEGDAVVRQRLPGLNEVHLSLHQVQILHVRVGFQDLLTKLKLNLIKIFISKQNYAILTLNYSLEMKWGCGYLLKKLLQPIKI